MSVLDKLSSSQNRRDQVPNQELARQLAESKDAAGIREIAENLWNPEISIQKDCVKVLYEIGYRSPEWITDFAEDFIKLLEHRHNQMVWGGMTALSTIGDMAADVIYPHLAKIQKAMGQGSVITRDAGVITLAKVASTAERRRREIVPYLLDHLKTCRPKDVAQHSENTLIAIEAKHRDAFVGILEKRLEDLSASQTKRVKRVIKKASER